MWRISLTGLWAHKRRVVAMAAAVVLGVAFLAGTLVFGDSMTAGIDDAITESNAGIDVVVRGEGELGDEASTQRARLDGRMNA